MAEPRYQSKSAGDRESQSWRRQNLTARASKLVASVLVALGFVGLLRYGGLPLIPPRTQLAQMSWWAVPLALLTFSVSTYYRTSRWIYLLRPIAPELSTRRVLGIGFVGFTAVVLAPLRMGEMVRPYLLSRDRQVTFTQGLSSVAAERILDGAVITLTLLLALFVATPLSPLPDHLGNLELDVGLVPKATYATLALFCCALIAMLVFYRHRATAQALVWRMLSGFSKRAAATLMRKVERVADGVSFLMWPRHLLPFLRDTAGYWGSLALGHWGVLYGCGVRATLAETWVVLGVLSIGILLPAGPGFFGAYQLSAYYGLAMFFEEELVLGSGAVFVFVTYVANLSITLLSCLVGFHLMATNPSAPDMASQGNPRPET